MSRKWNDGNTFLMVTGASKGLGQAFAIAIARHLLPESVIYLTARTEIGMIETKNKIVERNNKVKVQYFTIDHAKAERQTYLRMFESIDIDQFASAILIHNAGSIGKQGQMVRDYCDKEELMSYYSLNVFSVAVLNSIFMKSFSSVSKTVINISSLAALQPFASWGNYCAGKAARDAMFKVLAVEEDAAAPHEGCRVLNFAPGPVHTNMIEDVINDTNVYSKIKEGFVGMIQNNTILKPEQSAEKLVQILEEDKFKSGDHVDYYD